MARYITSAIAIFCLTSQAVVPAAAQMTTMPVQPTPRPTPAVQPPRPVYPGGPAVQPPRPVPPQPVRPRPPGPGYPGGPAIQPPRPTYPGNGNYRPPRPGEYARVIRCESSGNRMRRCNARTDNRVVLLRRLGGTCRYNSSWGYDRSTIWVNRGCRAEFGYGYGNSHGNPRPDDDRGPSAGAIIAGVAVAGGLLALLASSGKKKSETAESAPSTPQPDTPQTFPPGPPAALSANLASLPEASRASVETCLFETARQVGATGGTRLRYDRQTSLAQGNGGWRFGAALTATYPDGDRPLEIYCRATPTQVIELNFTNS